MKESGKDGRQLLGTRGEELARDYLIGRGLRPVAQNWRYGHKELDLVMEDDSSLRIVEVRTRSLNAAATLLPSQSVNLQKQRKLISAANAFVRRHNCSKEVIFDIVSIIAEGNRFHIEYLPDAFSPLL